MDTTKLEPTQHKCEKCGELVDPRNSYYMWGNKMNTYFATVGERHIYPTDKCEGWPEKVYYIESYPRLKEIYEQMKNGDFEGNLWDK